MLQALLSSLRSLDLAGNNLDNSAMQHLVKGNWPALRRLSLTVFFCWMSRPFRSFPKKNGQSCDTFLAHTHVSSDMMQELVKLSLPKLELLTLSGSGLHDKGMSALAKLAGHDYKTWCWVACD